MNERREDVNSSPKTLLDPAAGIGVERRSDVRWSDPRRTTTSSSAATRLNVHEILENLSHSGLIPASDLAAAREQTSGEESQFTVEKLAEWLVAQGKLTRYQAEMLCSGQVSGLVLGNYIVLDKLGQGGMGTVFKARHKRMNRLVALKVLPTSVTGIPEAMARFQREVEAAARLQHENIAVAYDADEANGVHFLVMEHVEGPNLATYVKERGPLPLAAAVQLIIQAARGLAAAHAKGVVHRDIKPSNLMVNRQGVLKVLDLGLAQLRDESSDLEVTSGMTQTGRVMGTVDFMAPEQARDAKSVDQRADIYSLGCTLYYLLSGLTPAPSGSATEKLLWHQTQDAPPLSSIVESAPLELEAAFRRMMARKADERYSSMTEVITDLERCLAELPGGQQALQLEGIELPAYESNSTAAGTQVNLRPVAQRSAAPRAARSRQLWIAGGVLVVVLGVCGAWYAFVPPDANPPSPTQVANNPAVVNPRIAEPPSVIPIPDAKVGSVVTPPASQDPDTKTASPALPPSPPEPPTAGVLRWAFQNGGRATLVTGAGKRYTASASGQLPAEDLELLGLDFSGTGIRDQELARLAETPGLRMLSLADTKITDDSLAELAKLHNLTQLDLTKTGVTSEGLKHLARLTELIELQLQQTNITNQGLGRLVALQKLERLYLADTSVGDAGFEQLRPLKSLRLLTANGTDLTETGRQSLAQALPDLEIAWDGADAQRALALRLLERGATLAIVDRAGQTLPSLNSREALPAGRLAVKVADLSTGSGFGDDDLKSLAALPEIETLHLGGTKVTAAGLAHLHGLPTLKEVDLGTLRMPATAIAAFENALPGCKLLRKEPADAQVARWTIESGGRVTIVNEKGVATKDIASPEKLPTAAEYRLRAIMLDQSATVDVAKLNNLAELADLESLSLIDTPVTDEGLAAIARCQSLRELSLSGTQVTADGVAQLARLPRLQRLYLANTSIGSRGVREAASLAGLTHLSLASVTLAEDDLPYLKRLISLEWLDLSGSPLADNSLASLSQLTSLRELHVSGTKLTDAGLEELTIALPACRVAGDPLDPQRLAARWILQNRGSVAIESGALTKPLDLPREPCVIRRIDLSELPQLKLAEIVKRLSICSGLEELALRDLSLGDAELAILAKLPRLKRLELNGAPVTDAVLAPLTSLSTLEYLDLTGTRVTGSGLKSLERSTQLRHLILGNSRLEAQHLAGLAFFPELETLDISGCRSANDASLALLAKLSHLRRLSLRGTTITDATLGKIATLPQLEQLDLEGTSISDAGVGKLTILKNLRYLVLSKTEISDGALGPLGELKQLKSLTLTRTQVTAEAAKQLQTSLPGCAITAPPPKNLDPTNPNASGFPVVRPARGS